MVKKYLLITLLFSTSTFAKTFDAGEFTVEYDDNVPISIVEQLASRISEKRKIVKAYLGQSKEYNGTPIKEDLVVYISKKYRTPYQNWNTIHIPEKRVLATFSPEKSEINGMAIIHELTHVHAVSHFRTKEKSEYGRRFFDDGLAVFLQHRFGESAEYPNYGQDLYRAVSESSISYGGLIALKDAENLRNSAKTGEGRRLAYLQEGAFTQYLIENYGLDKYLKIYAGKNIETVTGKTFSQLEKEWVTLIGEFMP